MAKLTLPMPHPGQVAVIEDKARFKWLVAGRRWRKTSLCLIAAVRSAVRGNRIIWGAPTYDQAMIGWKEMEKACGDVAKFHVSRMEVSLPNSGSVLFRSLDNPKNVRGHTADGVVLDEAPLCVAAAWEQVLRPMLSDTGGWAILGGTSAGHNWYWRHHRQAETESDSASWCVPTLGVKVTEKGLIRAPHPMENPDFSFEEAKQLFRTMPQRIFEQEFLGQFVADGGGVFRGVRTCIGDVEQAGTQDGHAYVIGADWGKVNDFTVFVVIDANLGHVVAMDRFNQIDTSLQVGRLKTMSARFGNCPIIGELNSIGMPIIEHAQAEGLDIIPFTTTNASKKLAIEALSLAFEQGTITIPDNEALVSELIAFQSKRLPSGMFRYEAPEGTHDDTVLALAIAWSGVVNVPCFEFASLS